MLGGRLDLGMLVLTRFAVQAAILLPIAILSGASLMVRGRVLALVTVRTLLPIAGIGTMSYVRFLAYNVVGGVTWVGGCLLAGYAFGNIPVVKNNFSLVILGIIGVSVLPLAIEYLRKR